MIQTEGFYIHAPETERERVRRQMEAIARPAELVVLAIFFGVVAAMVFGGLA